MKPVLVADVGNSRVKWGVVAPDGGSIAEVIVLPDDPEAWGHHLDLLARRASEETAPPSLARRAGESEETAPPSLARRAGESEEIPPPSLARRAGMAVLASVRPQRSERLAEWLQQQGFEVRRLHRPEELPLRIAVVEPRRVGIDRLLNGVAALRRLRPGEPAILVDAGSAVTVDWLDETHTFRGGTIFPGLRLMAEALHAYTALLPLVTVAAPVPEVPAPDTIPAMQAGIYHAVAGGIERIARLLAERAATPPRRFVTGGDGSLFASTPELWPEMTLEGILYAAETLTS